MSNTARSLDTRNVCSSTTTAKSQICLRDLSNYRDQTGSMPESPDTKLQLAHSNFSAAASVSSLSPISSMPPVTSRPLSTNSSLSDMNGTHSPHSSLNGRTPSPPSLSGTGSSQQLPPACGARQLSKLKRFLTTLQQFGSDISPEIGERVRSLVLGLVNSHLSIEEFHAKLQEATNFPLRPFVIPFLKANLPLLQRELVHCARLAKQTPQQYLSQNEHILFDAAHSPVESQDLSMEFNENGKRKSPDRPKENGLDLHTDLHPAKRAHNLSPAVPPPSRISPGGHSSSFSYPPGPMRLEDISINREMRERERLERERATERLERERAERDRHYSGNFSAFSRAEHFENMDRLEEDWRNVENMLHCIVGMVDKCKRALVALQEKSHRDREDAVLWMRRHSDAMENEIKKRNELLGSLRSDDRGLLEAKRRAVFDFPEEAVNEVKRQAVVELQKAVATAEAKASELVSSERSKLDRAIQEARKQTQQEMIMALNHQEESSESCWNCGRKASETCSGCNVARYCGSFCQHKDWESHHRVCGQGLASARIYEARNERGPERGRPSDRNPPGTTPVQNPAAAVPHGLPPPLPTTSASAVSSASSSASSTFSSSNSNNNSSQSLLPHAVATAGKDVVADSRRKSPTPTRTSPPVTLATPGSPPASSTPSNSRSESRSSTPTESKEVSR